VEVIAICDPNLVRARELASTFGIAHAFASHEDLLALEGIDFVTIGSPNAFHAPTALDALRSGRHVLVEKPIATTSVTARRVVAEARRRGLLLGVNQHLRSAPSTRIMRAAVESGSLGEVYLADVRLVRQSGIPGYGSWFTRADLAGAGALYDIGVHMLDLGLHLLGFPRVERVRGSVHGHLGSKGIGLGGWGDDRGAHGTFDVDDTAIATFSLEGGRTLRLHVAWASFGVEEERVTLHGTEGGADYSVVHHGRKRPLRLYGKGADGSIIETVPALPGGSHWRDGILQFVRAVCGSEPLAVPAEEAVEVLRLLERVIASSKAGREVAA
jgi:predicted dehydrogenase